MKDRGNVDGASRDAKFGAPAQGAGQQLCLHPVGVLDAGKIIVSRLGVDALEGVEAHRRAARGVRRTFTLLAIGRLHAVKDYAFLVRACVRLRDLGLDFQCVIAGEGPGRHRLELLIEENRLQDCFTLLGHASQPQLDALYWRADVVVLTSYSEGIPLVLMEAMMRGRVVLAPAITGIPEIVVHGKTGFLYAPGELQDFVARILFLEELMSGEDRSAVSRLDWIRHAARVQVLHNFGRRNNLNLFGERMLHLITTKDFATRNLAADELGTGDLARQDLATQDWSAPHEDPVLQQI